MYKDNTTTNDTPTNMVKSRRPTIEAELVPEPEAPSMNTIRSMRPAVAPMLSIKWMARRELPAVLCAGLPTMMMGPEDADQQSDNEDEVDETDPDYVPGISLSFAPPRGGALLSLLCMSCPVHAVLSVTVCGQSLFRGASSG